MTMQETAELIEKLGQQIYQAEQSLFSDQAFQLRSDEVVMDTLLMLNKLGFETVSDDLGRISLTSPNGTFEITASYKATPAEVGGSIVLAACPSHLFDRWANSRHITKEFTMHYWNLCKDDLLKNYVETCESLCDSKTLNYAFNTGATIKL